MESFKDNNKNDDLLLDTSNDTDEYEDTPLKEEQRKRKEKNKNNMLPLNLESNQKIENNDSTLDDIKMEDIINTNGSNMPWSQRINMWLYPPTQPKSVQLMRLENLIIPSCYLLVGLLSGLAGPLINVYPLDLGATEAQQVTLSSLRGLPASFKIIFGFISDSYPILGYRRKSYMTLGWGMASISMLCLLFLSDVRIPDVNEQENYDASNDDNEKGIPSISLLSITFLFSGIGLWFADVMADSIVAEKAKLEPDETRGQLQSTCYACRFFGLMIAAPFSTVIYSAYGPKFIIITMAILPSLILPLIYFYKERRVSSVDVDIKEQCYEIWNTVCSRAVWQPMGFVYLYNVMQVGNAAWREFLKSVLGFTSTQLNALLIAAYVLLYLGVMSYKFYFISWTWRAVYIVTTLLNGFFSILQVCLIEGWTFGIDPFLFALGDDAFMDFIGGIQFLPTTIMMVHLCPTGSEGASYAMFTTVNNSALNLSSAFSTMMLSIWDVSKETMMSGDLSGMTKLTILTTIIQTSAIIFVKLLPRSRDDLVSLHNDKYSGSVIGGSIFLFITIGSVFYAIFVSVMNIAYPGWMNES